MAAQTILTGASHPSKPAMWFAVWLAGGRATITSTRSRTYRPLLPIVGLLALSACVPPQPTFPTSRALAVPTEIELSRQPALAPAWADRLLSGDPSVRTAAGEVLVQAGEGSLPLL